MSANSAGDQARWRRHPTSLWRSAPGPTVVVLPTDASAPLLLRNNGAEMWLALDVPRTLDELVEAFAEAYRADPNVVRRDLAALMQVLADVAAVEPGL